VSRRTPPLHVQVKACLYLLGFTDADVIEWHHTPAIGLREQLKNGRYRPDLNDPKHIVPMRKADHARQTNGTPATTAGSDKHAIAKAKRIADKQAEFRRLLLAPGKRPKHERMTWGRRK
jgi:hypothetical protein